MVCREEPVGWVQMKFIVVARRRFFFEVKKKKKTARHLNMSPVTRLYLCPVWLSVSGNVVARAESQEIVLSSVSARIHFTQTGVGPKISYVGA